MRHSFSTAFQPGHTLQYDDTAAEQSTAHTAASTYIHWTVQMYQTYMTQIYQQGDGRLSQQPSS